MLLRLTMKNFLSFYYETSFDMFPNPKRERFQNHIYEKLDVPLLKQSAIYGANGAGKSNVVKALSFLKFFTTKIDFFSKVEFDDYRFQLKKNNTDPFSLKIEFFEKHYFIYEVNVGKKISETLYLSGLGERDDVEIFKRENDKITGEGILSIQASEALLKKNLKSSVLALNKQFPILENSYVNEAYGWFRKTLVTASIDFHISSLIPKLDNDSRLLQFSSDFMKKLKISDDLKISKSEFNEWLKTRHGEAYKKHFENHSIESIKNYSISASSNRRNEFFVVHKDGKDYVQEFSFDQVGLDGFRKGMNIDSQSDGSVRLLTILPLVYEAIHNHKVVVIDEIENSMHPNLVYQLVKYYGESGSNGQLIFTTHLTKLMNQQDLSRLDEMWIVDKENGNSSMRSLNDYKIHNTINVENGYLEGRYGGVPQIDPLEVV